MSRPRVLLADDHRIVAEGLKGLLEPEFELIEIVENGRALVDATKRVRPDVIVADISMPELNGIDALMLLKRDDPDVRVVFLTMHRDVNYARRAIEAGGLGFVLKHAATRELVLALRAAKGCAPCPHDSESWPARFAHIILRAVCVPRCLR